MATQLSRKQSVQAPQIPDRLYFKIGDVARICELEPYVLRFWETQFPQLKPNKSGTGQRLYRRRDVELVLDIKRLVHGDGYTISGARQALEQERREPRASKAGPAALTSSASDTLSAAIGRARAELRAIAVLLASPVAARPQRRRPRITSIASGDLFPS